MKTLIVAEAGVNHNGCLERATQMVACAAEAGADAVKFQTFIAEKSISKNAPKADYQKNLTDTKESQLEMARKFELSRADHEILVEECRQRGISFFSTPFDQSSFDMLSELGCLNIIKISSGELTNLPLLRHITKFGKPVLLSTGMASLGEVEAAIGVIESSGTPRSKITILHCSTEYPAPMTNVNLLTMVNMQKMFGVDVNYSDHTLGIEIPIAAVALGASVIEKHFTLDRNLPGPDHKASLEPQELKSMVKSIRNVELALGNGIKQLSVGELKNKSIARKSIVARCNIKQGELFSEKNITSKRPGTGLSPMLWDDVIGKSACCDFSIDELITL